MKNRWKSYIYVPVLACILAVGGVYIWNTKTVPQTENQEQIYYLDEYFEADVNRPTEAHVVDEQDVVLENTPDTITEPQAEFVLRMVDNYVIVYRSDNLSESFMATGINMADLPTETQNEILNGKEIMDEEALYFFLESHSS